MEQNIGNKGTEENIPDPEEIRELHPIEECSETLEPFIDEEEHRTINQDDDKEIAYWAQEFQISQIELKEAILLNGNAVREIKKYLSI